MVSYHIIRFDIYVIHASTAYAHFPSSFSCPDAISAYVIYYRNDAEISTKDSEPHTRTYQTLNIGTLRWWYNGLAQRTTNVALTVYAWGACTTTSAAKPLNDTHTQSAPVSYISSVHFHVRL